MTRSGLFGVAVFVLCALALSCTPTANPPMLPDPHGLEASVCRGADAYKSVPLSIPATRVVAADLDGDGSDDLAWIAASGTINSEDVGLYFALNLGDGTFAEQNRVSSTNFRTLQAIDVDQDGHKDIVVTAKNSTFGFGGVFVFVWQPDAADFAANSYAGPTDIPGFVVETDIDIALAADLDADGHIEMLLSDIVTNGGAPPVILHGSGPGTFSEAYVATGAVRASGFVSGFAAADLSGDGKLDLIMGYQDDSLVGASIAVQDSDFSFLPSEFSGIGGGGAPVVIDLDADGVPDLLWGLVLYRGLGGAAFGAAEQIAPTFTEIARDLDGDGLVDLVGADELNSGGATTLAISYGTGAVAFSTADSVAIPRSISVAAADFDGVRGVDFVVDGAAGGGMTLLLSRCIAE